jgi:large subunit ribosomal protein L28
MFEWLAGPARAVLSCRVQPFRAGMPRLPRHHRLFKEEVMARTCDLCGKGVMRGNRVSHAHNVSRRVWNPNLQNVRALVKGRAQQMKVCTRCLKAGKVQKAVRKPTAA